jgi:hypothetical protein
LDFLWYLFDSGLEYSAINTARCMLSGTLGLFDGVSFGKHDLVTRFLKGAFNVRPPRAKYSATWDVNFVLMYLRRLSPVAELSLKDLTIKLTMLLALTTGQRGQTLHLLDLKNLAKGKEYKFGFSVPLKHSRVGASPPVVCVSPYPPDRRLCVLTVLKEYIRRTSLLRGSETYLLISYIRPHRRVSRDTVGRWIKVCLVRSGIDINKYAPHSTRMASTSKAKGSAVSTKTILEAAGWSNAGTFQKFYHRDTDKSFQAGVLGP